jgi:hypothetical protein
MAKKTTRKTNRTGKGRGRVCRVSYTLNNTQPVTSTIIGDQPLFYLNYEDSFEDEVFGGSDVFSEDDFADRAYEASSYGMSSDLYPDSRAETVFSSEVRMEEFLFESAAICRPVHTDVRGEPIGTRLEDLERLVSSSRFAAALYNTARIDGITLAQATHVENAFYDSVAGKIFIHPRLDRAEAALCIVRELRRVWQIAHGGHLNPLRFHPDHAILVNRAQQADLAVAMVRAAWEFQLSGERAAWERLEMSSMSDLVRVFAREAFLDFRTLNNGQACAAAFESWFLSERCRRFDKALIQNMLADYQGTVFGSDQTSRTVSAEIIAALGTMPFGKNYLLAHARTILTDPVFTEVRDRANANFLWFIKFEKSFRDAEQELQQGEGPSGPAIRPDRFPTLTWNGSHEQERKSNVIALPQRASGNKTGSVLPSRRRPSSGGAQIIDLPRRPGEGGIHF